MTGKKSLGTLLAPRPYRVMNEVFLAIEEATGLVVGRLDFDHGGLGLRFLTGGNSTSRDTTNNESDSSDNT